MSPVYLNPQNLQNSFLEFKGDHLHQQHSLSMFGYSYFSSCSNPENLQTSTEFLAMDYSKRAQDKVVEEVILSHNNPNDLGQVIQSSSTKYGYNNDGSGCSYVYNNNSYDEADPKPDMINNDHQRSKKCKPTKLKILQTSKSIKIRGENKVVHNNNHHFNQPSLRMCSDCHTTTTPLWRSGPQGPKSLCNACGIRQRKAKRAAMAAAAAEAAKYEVETSSMSSTTTTITTMTTTPTNVETPKVIVKDMSSKIKQNFDNGHTLPLKKRCKTLLIADWNNNNNSNSNNNSNNNENDNTTSIIINNNSHKGKMPCVDDFELSSSSVKNYSMSPRAFSRDEEEGALLLMALSSGMACFS